MSPETRERLVVCPTLKAFGEGILMSEDLNDYGFDVIEVNVGSIVSNRVAQGSLMKSLGIVLVGYGKPDDVQHDDLRNIVAAYEYQKTVFSPAELDKGALLSKQGIDNRIKHEIEQGEIVLFGEYNELIREKLGV